MITPTMYPEHQYSQYIYLIYMLPVFLLLVILMLVMLTSCDDKVISGNTEAVISITAPEGEKLLTVSTPSNITAFEYRATPLFGQDEDIGEYASVIIGSTEGEWKSIEFRNSNGEVATVGELTASAGYYQQGRWEIEIRALNAGGHVVYSGTTGEVYLNSNRNNAFTIQLHGERFDGVSAAIDITFTGLETEDGKGMVPSLTIEYLDGGKEVIKDGWTVSKVKDGVMEYKLTKAGLDSGEVEGTVMLSTAGGEKQTAETFKTVLINGETTVVTGTLESGLFARPAFDIEEDKSEVKGSIVAREGATVRTSAPLSYTMQAGTSAVFGFDIDSAYDTGDALTISWRSLGVVVGTGDTFTFSPLTAGNYSLTAIVERNEKTYSSEVIIVVTEGV